MDASFALPTTPVTAASVPVDKARPVLDRIVVLDILRGIALIGMFIVHFNMYEATPAGVEPGRVAAFVQKFIGLFIEERFWGIFGMLFGIGFAVQLTRAEARGEPFVARYLRRLAALAVFGIIAEGVFGYNVLFGYALWGVPLLLVRKWPVKALVVLLLLCASSRQLYMVGQIAAASGRPDGVAQYFATEDANWATFKAVRDSLHAAEQSPSWRTVVPARMKFMPTFHRQWSVFPNLSFVLFLMGLIAWKLGLFTQPEKHKRLIASLAVAGAVLWAMSTWVMPIGGPPAEWPPTRAPLLNTILAIARGSGFALVRSQWLAWTYIGIVLLLVAHNRALAPAPVVVRLGRAHGADELPDAGRAARCAVHAARLRAESPGVAGVPGRDRAVRGAGGDEPLVAGEVPPWSDRVGVAVRDELEGAAVAD